MIPGRLVELRPVESGDLPFLQFLANNVHVGGSVVGWDFPVSLHGQEAWLAASRADRSNHRLVVQEKESGSAVGLTGLWDVDWHNQTALTATKLDPDSQHRGLGSDAIMTTMAWAFFVVGLRRLHSTVLDFNEASLRAYVDRCGWRVEGRHREAIFRRGRWCDLYSIASLRTDFERLDLSDEYTSKVAPVAVDAVSPRAVDETFDAPRGIR